MVLSMRTGYARKSNPRIGKVGICTRVLQDFREATQWMS
jgi:hypothetical protein